LGIKHIETKQKKEAWTSQFNGLQRTRSQKKSSGVYAGNEPRISGLMTVDSSLHHLAMRKM
jgi:hypothetical protein